jgi:NADH-quinone oxidoreductase subunit F
MSDNLSELLGRKGVHDNLFDHLGQLAKPKGTPSEEELAALADDFLIGKANAFGTASFYDFLKPENKGKKAYVCNGTACVCAGTQNNVIAALQTKFQDDEIGHMTCLGRCHENSAFHYNGQNYSGDALENLNDIIDSDNNFNQDTYTVKAQNKEILTSSFTTVDEYYKPFIEALQKDSADVLEEIKTSNVRGRGGAGFPMGLKLEFCRNVENETKFIICNADEGDPGAYSDRYLLEHQPHSVLFGMLISGYVTHAKYGILYIRAEYPEAVDIVQDAINALKEKELIGDNIKGSGFSFDLKLFKPKDRISVEKKQL